MNFILLIVIFCLILFIFFVLIFRNILKNKKISAKISIPQVAIISVLSVIFMLGLFFIGIVIKQAFSNSKPMCGNFSCSSLILRAISSVNQALTTEKQLGNTISYNSVQDYATIFAKNLILVDLKYLETEKYKYSEYNQKEIEGNVMRDFVGNPIIIDKYGFIYMFKKFENYCKTVDIENIENNDCIMVVDINGNKQPNELIFSDFEVANETKDRYFLIIDGNNDTVIHPKMYHWKQLKTTSK